TSQETTASPILALLTSRGPGVFGASPGEDVPQAIVALVAGVLEHGSATHELVLAAPRLVPHGRVDDLEAVVHPLGGDHGEAFDHLQVLPRPAIGLAFRQVRGLDHQGVALPPADGVA